MQVGTLHTYILHVVYAPHCTQPLIYVQVHPLTSQMMQQPGFSTPNPISISSSSPSSGSAVGFNRTGSFSNRRPASARTGEHKQRVLAHPVFSTDAFLLVFFLRFVIQNEVSVTTTLSTKKHETGYRCINNYIVGKELGQGTSGEVNFHVLYIISLFCTINEMYGNLYSGLSLCSSRHAAEICHENDKSPSRYQIRTGAGI